MLIQKNSVNKDDILCFKLVNGDEVVAKLVDLKEDKFIVSKPCTVMPSPKGIGLMQSLFCGELNIDIELRKDHILMYAPVVKEMESHYLSTVTGITTVSKGSIVV